MVYFWSKGFRLFLIFNLSYVFAAFFTFIHSLDERWITKDCVSTAGLFLRGFRDWTRAVNVHTVYINERTKIDNGKVKGGFISLLKRKENLVGLISFVIKSLVGIHPVEQISVLSQSNKTPNNYVHGHQHMFLAMCYFGGPSARVFWNRDEKMEEIFKMYRDKNRDFNLWAVRGVNKRYTSDETICPLWTFAIKLINSRPVSAVADWLTSV